MEYKNKLKALGYAEKTIMNCSNNKLGVYIKKNRIAVIKKIDDNAELVGSIEIYKDYLDSDEFRCSVSRMAHITIDGMDIVEMWAENNFYKEAFAYLYNNSIWGNAVGEFISRNMLLSLNRGTEIAGGVGLYISKDCRFIYDIVHGKKYEIKNEHFIDRANCYVRLSLDRNQVMINYYGLWNMGFGWRGIDIIKTYTTENEVCIMKKVVC